MFLVNTSKIAQFVNPVTNPPWKDVNGVKFAAISLKEVEAASPKLHPEYDRTTGNYSRAFHLERIAYFYKNGVHQVSEYGHHERVVDVITPPGASEKDPKMMVGDGDEHQLAAAILRGEEFVPVVPQTMLAHTLLV